MAGAASIMAVTSRPASDRCDYRPGLRCHGAASREDCAAGMQRGGQPGGAGQRTGGELDDSGIRVRGAPAAAPPLLIQDRPGPEDGGRADKHKRGQRLTVCRP
jgi:hypothetical protein